MPDIARMKSNLQRQKYPKHAESQKLFFSEKPHSAEKLKMRPSGNWFFLRYRENSSVPLDQKIIKEVIFSTRNEIFLAENLEKIMKFLIFENSEFFKSSENRFVSKKRKVALYARKTLCFY